VLIVEPNISSAVRARRGVASVRLKIYIFFISFVVNFCQFSTRPPQPVNPSTSARAFGSPVRSIAPASHRTIARVSSGLGVRFARGNETRPSSTVVALEFRPFAFASSLR
jgi:hypothetical protein